LSFDCLDLAHSCDTTNDSHALRESLLHLYLKYSDLMDEVDRRLESMPFSPTLGACKCSLLSDASILFEETKVLLENLGKEGSVITSWRASLAQIRVDSYIETIHSAMQHQSREILDMELLSVTDSLAYQTRNGIEMQVPSVTISFWKSPSLVFNVTAGPLIIYHHEFNHDQLPLKLKVTAIAEVVANEVVLGSVGSYQPCIVGIKKCNHESRSFCAPETGIVGDCSLTVRLAPLGAMKQKKTTWGVDKEVGYLCVKEVRTVQVNAFPPKPKTAVDLYTSCTHGDRDTTITLRFSTSKTLLTDEIPEVHVELVMGSFNSR